jgi:ketosteroid isomerase-like protein
MRTLAWIVISVFGFLAVPAEAQPARHPTSPESPEAAVDAFHHALKGGDRETALALLATGVVIFESGGAEMSRDEYASHHLGSDMKFSAAVDTEIIDRHSGWSGESAWVLTRSRTRGTYGDREIDSRSTETMILAKTEDSWRIVHIHWSSRSE